MSDTDIPKIRTRSRSAPTSQEPKPSDYEVGYGRPPRSSRFRPGRSGNPRGRPKGARSLRTIFDQALREKISYLENGKRNRAERRELIIMRLFEKALKGDLRAIDRILRLEAELVGETPDNTSPPPGNQEEIDAGDEAILAEMFPGLFQNKEDQS